MPSQMQVMVLQVLDGDSQLRQATAFGPYDLNVADGASGTITVPLAGGSTLVYVGIAGRDASAPTWVRFAIFRTARASVTKREIRLEPQGDRYVDADAGRIVKWMGRFLIPEIEEYTLEVIVLNQTGDSARWSVIAHVEGGKHD